jgi:phosphoribosyl 1,2-cyclic phosphodiesterase
MRFASLGSGSAGNALVAEVGQTRLLLDCGFGLRETALRLARLNLEPDQITGILVTHEHDDHIGGVFKFAARHRLPVYITHGTLAVVQHQLPKAPIEIQIIDGHTTFEINDAQIEPFPVPHDAREPVQFVIGDGKHRLGVLTDTGTSTPHIENILSGCEALVLECNHDLELMMNGSYPWSLKQRLSSRYGHLDNAAAATLLSRLNIGKLQHLIAAHLSEKNNTPELASQALSSAINCAENWVGIAHQATGFGWRQIS